MSRRRQALSASPAGKEPVKVGTTRGQGGDFTPVTPESSLTWEQIAKRATSAAATRGRVKTLIKRLFGDVIDNSAPGEVDVNVYSPPGTIWVATDCHSLTCRFYTDPAAGWAALEEDLRKGLAKCDTKDCEVCSEATWWWVIYMDPKTKDGSGNTLHRAGCRDIEASKRRGGNPRALKAVELDKALIEAQYQGLEPGDGTDLGDVTLAPCVKVAAREVDT